MTERDIYNEFARLLDFLFVTPGHPAFWQQEPYRSDFFKLFVESYPIHHLHGDRIAETLRETWLKQDDPRHDEKSDVLFEVCQAWTEWRYAWDKKDALSG